MRYDWRYGFHSFWFLMTLMLMMSPVIFIDRLTVKHFALGTMAAILIVDYLFTRQYPYFNRFGRQGFSGLLSIGFFVVMVAVAPYFGYWSPSAWGFVSFCVASFGGSLDGRIAHPTDILVNQTRAQLRKKAEILRKPMPR